ncbi:MAG: DUF2231 domain-containing protein [Nitrospirota bacterium]|nr:DUF2231 domain-containing protein [Nitrospirota bacterium]
MEHFLSHLLDPSRLHPAIVHFPIALFTASLFFDLLSLLLNRHDFRKTAFHLLALGVLSAIAAIGAGLMAAETADAPEDILTIHSRLAVATTVLFALLLGWRAKTGNFSSPRLFPVYLVAAVIGAVMILTVGFWGGHMVFEEGAGVRPDLLHRNHQEEMLPEPDFGAKPSVPSPSGHDHGKGDGHQHAH